jgi:hypothetical protein
VYSDDFPFHDTKKIPGKAREIPISFSAIGGSLYKKHISNKEKARLIFVAIEVVATPFCCELNPITTNREMKRIPEKSANDGHSPENE